jgi:hypothetical protein
MKPSIENLASALREIYVHGPKSPELAFETYLAEELQGIGPDERLMVLNQLQDVFAAVHVSTPDGLGGDLMDRLVPLLLGKDISPADLTTPELVSRLAHALDTIFNTLNDLIHLINSTFGGSPAGDETIRQIIGTSLSGEGKMQSIEEYLNQIKKAFLASQQSSKEAAWTVAGYILTELDPKGMDQTGSAFRIGALKKADAFDLFEEKYERVRKWFESERFLLDFLGQFEKNCQRSFT